MIEYVIISNYLLPGHKFLKKELGPLLYKDTRILVTNELNDVRFREGLKYFILSHPDNCKDIVDYMKLHGGAEITIDEFRQLLNIKTTKDGN